MRAMCLRPDKAVLKQSKSQSRLYSGLTWCMEARVARAVSCGAMTSEPSASKREFFLVAIDRFVYFEAVIADGFEVSLIKA
jgi:hypothetical protein